MEPCWQITTWFCDRSMFWYCNHTLSANENPVCIFKLYVRGRIYKTHVGLMYGRDHNDKLRYRVELVVRVDSLRVQFLFLLIW